MRRFTPLILCLIFAATLNAQQNRETGKTLKDFELPQMMPTKSSAAIDTLVPYPAGCDTSLALTGATEGGFVMGWVPMATVMWRKPSYFPIRPVV